MDCKWIFSSVFWALLCVLLSSRLSWDQFPHTHTEESVLHRGAQALVWFMHVVLCISLLYYVCVVSDTVSSDDKSLHSYQCNGGQWFWAQYFTTSHDVTSSLCVTPSLLACSTIWVHTTWVNWRTVFVSLDGGETRVFWQTYLLS